MPLSAIDRKPPPFFRQGTSALTKTVLLSALAVFLMAADTRFRMTAPLRGAIATGLLPIQQMLQVPVRLADEAAGYLRGFKAALNAADASRAQLVRQSSILAQVDQLQAENKRLRALLGLAPAITVHSISAEVLYEAADPYSRKVFIDRGAHHGVRPGSPVLTEQGVLGQVTAVYPLSSVVTMLIDRDAAIPVLNRRTLQRAAAFGGADGGAGLELRFLAANADVQVGDMLSTSGLDGVYPSDLVVGKVAKVERRSDAGFARILVTPAASADGVRHLLVLEPVGLQLPPRPPAEEPVGAGKGAKDKATAGKAVPASATAGAVASAVPSATATASGAAAKVVPLRPPASGATP